MVCQTIIDKQRDKGVKEERGKGWKKSSSPSLLYVLTPSLVYPLTLIKDLFVKLEDVNTSSFAEYHDEGDA